MTSESPRYPLAQAVRAAQARSQELSTLLATNP